MNYTISKEQIDTLKIIYNLFNDLEVKGLTNVEIVFKSMGTLKNTIIEIEKNIQKEE